MTTPKDALVHTVAANAEASAKAAAVQAVRLAYSLAPRIVVADDSRAAQLQRCIAKAQRVMSEANAVPAYLGSDPKRRRIVVDANWRSHAAMLRRDRAQAALMALSMKP
jgi:hypothetical protein